MAEPSADADYIVIRIRRPPFIAFIAIAQLLAAFVFSRDNSGDWYELVGMGILYTQPCLFAAWLVFGVGQVANRVQWTLFTFAVALAFPSAFPGSGVFNPGDLFIRVTHFVASLAIASAAKRATGWRLSREQEVHEDSGSSVTFSIKSLLLWTAAWALYLAFVRSVMRDSGTGSMDWSDVLLGLGLFSLFFAPLTFWAAALLSPHLICHLSFIALIVWIFGSIGANIWLAFLGDNDVLLWLIITCGGLLSVCLATIPLRLAGYRLRRANGAPNGAS
jgi:hypothetical protein